MWNLSWAHCLRDSFHAISSATLGMKSDIGGLGGDAQGGDARGVGARGGELGGVGGGGGAGGTGLDEEDA